MTAASLNAALAGRYEIERELGAGGMATVYLARDVKHDRRVALKVLRPELAAVIGAERFLSEIKTTANLQHPHILPLFDSGTADNQLFYVMPYVEGETLRGRLDRETQLPVADAVRLAAEVAGALEYAHRHGVVHRDIKPENILLQDGGALVADFGIALAVQHAGGERMTQTGMSLGTPHYMSPEQAMGQKVIDARSDIYALGAVTYEMLIGEPPFTGPTAQAIVAKVMTESPKEITAQRKTVPLNVADAVAKSLEKLPADRFGSAKEFAEALGNPGATLHATQRARAIAPGSTTGRGALWAAMGIAALSIAALVWSLSRPTPAPEVVRFRVDDGPSIRAMATTGIGVAVSADGKTVAYISKGDSIRTLLVRRIGEMGASPLAGIGDLQTTADLHYSADGRWLSMSHNGRRVRIPAAGGPAVVVAPEEDGDAVVNNNFGGTAVTPSGDIVYVRGFEIRLAVAGSPSTLLAAPDSTKGETALRFPMFIPGGEHLLFTVVRGVSGTGLGLVTLDGKARRTFALPLANAIGYVDGWLVYGTSAGEINAVRFDPKGGVTGDPITVLTGAVVTPPGAVVASLSPSGTLAYLGGESNLRLMLLDANGVERASLGTRGRYYSPRFSPDGRQLAFSINDGLWVHDIASGVATPRTAPGKGIRPAWTPDGQRIAYIYGEANEIRWMPADGSGPGERLFKGTGGRPREVTFTPDGRHVAMRFDPNSAIVGSQNLVRHIYLAAVAGGAATPLIATPNVNQQPAISPDGRWLAYASNETGSYEVYVWALSGGARVLISAAGATEPKWVGNTQLVYRVKRSGSAFWKATLSTNASAVSVVRRDSLFADPYLADLNGSQNYDISRDGRFAVTREPGDGVMLIAVVNWVTELRAKLKGK